MIANLNPRSTFDSYVVGRENGLAASAARAVAETPGAAYNPLCIVGDAGLGKTHLLMAIAQAIEKADSRYSVEYFTPEGLSEAYHAAVSAGQGDAFRNRLVDTDVLLVDDLHALPLQEDIQAELVRATTELQGAGKQIVVASQVTPASLEGVDETLIERLADGLVVAVGAPEYETRVSILQRRSDERGARFTEGVLEAVASYEITDVRELIGVLNRLVALQAVSETPLTPDAARALYEGEVSGAGASAGEPGADTIDQFADFLSGVTDTVKRQVDAWESRLNEATKRWAERGYCTDRLATVTTTSSGKTVDETLEEFERDVEELRTLRDSVSGIDASLADDPAFFDPDRLVEARGIAEKVVSKPPALTGPSSAWRFEGFIGSWANAVAVEATKAVSAYPGQERNPLVLVGSTGVGKTHLLHATGNAIAETLRTGVVCVNVRELAEALADAEAGGTVDDLREELNAANALLIDDLHLAVGNESLQKILGAAFSRAYESQRQIVCTIDEDPRESSVLDESLRTTLMNGFVGTLAAPDRELRHGLVVSMLQDNIGAVDSALADYLADRPADSVREVTGSVVRVLDEAESRGIAPSAALARELIEGSVSEAPRRTPGVRTSGVLVAPSSSVRSVEKMIWVWPDPSERLIEELS